MLGHAGLLGQVCCGFRPKQGIRRLHSRTSICRWRRSCDRARVPRQPLPQQTTGRRHRLGRHRRWGRPELGCGDLHRKHPRHDDIVCGAHGESAVDEFKRAPCVGRYPALVRSALRQPAGTADSCQAHACTPLARHKRAARSARPPAPTRCA